MKIALVGSTAPSFIRFREGLIISLVKKGLEVYVLCNDYDQNTAQKVKDLRAIPVHYKMNRSGLNPFTDLIQTYQLTKILSSLKCDIVLSFFAKPSIYGTLAAKIAGVTRIYAMLEGLGTTFTVTPTKKYKLRFVKFFQLLLYRIAFRFLNALIVLNPDDKKELIEKSKLRLKVCHVLGGIGLNLNDFPKTPITEGPTHFLFIGRLLKEKGIQEFFEASAIVKARHPQVIITAIGSLDPDNPSNISEQELAKMKSLGTVNFVGQVSNVFEWIARCSVFVLPSYREGIPRSTQEAMAVGRAIITTDVPGCRETVMDGHNGFLVPPFSAQAIADKMCYFIENTDQISQMGDASYLLAKEYFDENKVNSKLLNLLEL